MWRLTPVFVIKRRIREIWYQTNNIYWMWTLPGTAMCKSNSLEFIVWRRDEHKASNRNITVIEGKHKMYRTLFWRIYNVHLPFVVPFVLKGRQERGKKWKKEGRKKKGFKNKCQDKWQLTPSLRDNRVIGNGEDCGKFRAQPRSKENIQLIASKQLQGHCFQIYFLKKKKKNTWFVLFKLSWFLNVHSYKK